MKRILTTILLLAMALGITTLATADVSPLTDSELLIVTVDGVNVNFDWSAMPEAPSYTLYYASADFMGDVDINTIGTIEMGDATTFFVPGLPSGLNLYTAIMAHTHQGDIPSNIVSFMTFGGSVTYHEGSNGLLMQLDDPGGIGNFTVSGSVDADTVNITQISGDDGSGPFILTIIDDKPVTYVKGDVTIDFTSIFSDSAALQMARTLVESTSQEVLTCREEIVTRFKSAQSIFEEEYNSYQAILKVLSDLNIGTVGVSGPLHPMSQKLSFLISLLVGSRADLAEQFEQDKTNFVQEYEACGSDPVVIDETANSCRLLYDPSLDEDGDHLIWVGNEENGFKCYYHGTDTGRLSSELPFLNGVQDGIATSFYEDGTLQGEMTWLNGEQHGMSRTYFPNSNIWYETPMFHNLQDGIQKIYYESGSIKQEIPWYQGDDFVDGVYKRYGENGNLNYETTYDENGKETGVRSQYYESGQLKSFFTLVSNRGNGEYKSFYESGQLQREVTYVDNDYHGTLKDFSADGTLNRCRIYDHGSDEGSCMP